VTHATELARYARARLRQTLGGPAASPPPGDWGKEPGATFVTLRWRDGRLQGCIGSIEPRRAIVNDVAHNVVSAALHDPRGAPVGLSDVDELDVEVSVLSSLEPVSFRDEPSALAALRPGEDGVVFDASGKRATFLPAVWKSLPDPRAFLGELKKKAGLSPSYWGADVKLHRYRVERSVDRAP